MTAKDSLVSADINGRALRRRHCRIHDHTKELLHIHVRRKASIDCLGLPRAVCETVEFLDAARTSRTAQYYEDALVAQQIWCNRIDGSAAFAKFRPTNLRRATPDLAGIGAEIVHRLLFQHTAAKRHGSG